ncbi:MAG: 50S ribosomal protein L13 [Erysipelotrichaceae bacterium]|jgi:large subunit ribosomal protein L13|nr:50S ribosomal protein L13 [Erysipelotrichaceae bacterium]
MYRQTTLAKPLEVKRQWYVIDATDKPLGRLASEVAMVLMGKNKPSYTPNVDCGDYVIVLNAPKVKLTGDKVHGKKYYSNRAQITGGLRTRTAGEMVAKYPVELVTKSVWGMIPKGRLGRQMIKKLFVYEGEAHKHEAQKPTELKLRYLGE